MILVRGTIGKWEWMKESSVIAFSLRRNIHLFQFHMLLKHILVNYYILRKRYYHPNSTKNVFFPKEFYSTRILPIILQMLLLLNIYVLVMI